MPAKAPPLTAAEQRIRLARRALRAATIDRTRLAVEYDARMKVAEERFREALRRWRELRVVDRNTARPTARTSGNA